MLTYDMYRYIFFGTLAACIIMALVAVILFFVLKIPRVVGDLTGSTARKAIEEIRKQNEQSGDKTYKSSAVNLQRGKVTDKISKSGRLMERGESPFGTGKITAQLDPSYMPASETTVLDMGPANETTVLSEPAGETTVLDAPAQPQVQAQQFEIEYEITFIHTNEVIA